MGSDWISAIQYDEDHPNVEAIMRQIRERLAGEHGISAPTVSDDAHRKPFAREVYDELYEAHLASDRLYVSPYMTPTRVPILGPIWQRVRSLAHRLVVFYVARLAEAQMRFNAHVVHVLDGVVQGISADETPDKVQQLERRVQALEERLSTYERAPSAERPHTDEGER